MAAPENVTFLPSAMGYTVRHPWWCANIWRESLEEYDVGVVLAAPKGELFDGVELWDALASLGLTRGDMDMFHWDNPHHDCGDDHLFSVGTSTAPGYLFPEEAAAGRLRVALMLF
jgi:hypothetical protein